MEGARKSPSGDRVAMKTFIMSIQRVFGHAIGLSVVLVTLVAHASADGPIVGIIVDDDKPRAAMKLAEYINDFLEYDIQIITKSQYKESRYNFAATVKVEQSGRENTVSLSVTVRTDSSFASHGGGIRFNSQVPAFVTHNLQAMGAAIYVLKALSTDSWKGLVKEFEDAVEELNAKK